MKKMINTGVMLLLWFGFCQPATGSILYQVTDLGTLGGSGSHPYAVNNAGQVVGLSYDSGGTQRPFIWQGGAMTDLGVLPGHTGGRAYGINGSGQVAGMSWLSYGGPTEHACIWSAGSVVDLGSVFSSWSYAKDINDAGQVVGNQGGSGFLWSAGIYTDFGAKDPVAINNSGQVLLQWSELGIPKTGIWENGTLTQLSVPVGYSWVRGKDINDQGQVVGELRTSSAYYRAFLWEAGTYTYLGTLGYAESAAQSLNENGQVVGYVHNSGEPQLGFVWEDGHMQLLRDLVSTVPGRTINGAVDINDSGEIVVSGQVQGNAHALLLKPIPEPATLSLLALGGLAVIPRRRMG